MKKRVELNSLYMPADKVTGRRKVLGHDHEWYRHPTMESPLIVVEDFSIRCWFGNDEPYQQKFNKGETIYFETSGNAATPSVVRVER